MKRRTRGLEIFSLSALDLFASAMGVFIVITIMLFPYYLKNHEVVSERDRLREDLQATKVEAAMAEARADASESAAAEAQQRAAAASARAAAAEQRAQTAEAAAEATQRQIQQAREQAQAAQRQAAEAQRAAQESTVFALLGINSKAKSFVILIDMSESMNAYTRVMVETMERVLAPLDPDKSVQIIGYSAPGNVPRMVPWQPGGTLVPMTEGNKQQAMGFVRSLAARFDGRTPTGTALVEALRYPAQSIILLSDGAPTDARGEDIVARVSAMNQGQKEINTVAIGDYNKDPRLVQFLQQLARQNKGGFTGVAR